MDAIYLDHNASAPLPAGFDEIASKLLRETFGNPSSLHGSGRRSRRVINDATEEAAAYLGCHHHQLFWTSGASEANSWVIHSALARARREHPERAPRLIVSSIEHESVLLAANAAEEGGAIVERCPVDAHGVARLDVLESLLLEPADLVSIMYANNETGVIQPVAEVARLCSARAVPYHCDAVQALGRLPLVLEGSGITYASFSAHKIGAPKGVGFLAVTAKGRLLEPMIHGKQQKELRGGTENPFGAAMAGRILQALRKGKLTYPATELSAMHRRFEGELRGLIPGTVVHGEGVARLPNTSFVGFTGIEGDGVLMALDLEGVHASSGSACTSGSTDPSDVLLAMGCDANMARSSVRFSSGWGTTWEDFEKVLQVLPAIVGRARAASKAKGPSPSRRNIEVQL